MPKTQEVTFAPNELSALEVEVSKGAVANDVVSNDNIAVFDYIQFGITVGKPNEFGDCAVSLLKDGFEISLGTVSVGVDVGEELLFRTAKQLVSRTLTSWALLIR